MKTGWLAAALCVGCVCNVQVPQECELQGGACQSGSLNCARQLDALCDSEGDICCKSPGGTGGGSGTGGSGGSGAGGGSSTGGGSTGGGGTDACLIQGGACQPSSQGCGMQLTAPCPAGDICCWVPDAAGGGSATGGGGAGSTCPSGVGECAPAALCPGTSLTQYTCGGDTVCCPLPQCDETALTDFINAHKSCSVDADCTPVCLLGASCDTGAVNAAGAAAFASTFASCHFPMCDIACFAAHCTTGACSP